MAISTHIGEVLGVQRRYHFAHIGKFRIEISYGRMRYPIPYRVIFLVVKGNAAPETWLISITSKSPCVSIHVGIVPSYCCNKSQRYGGWGAYLSRRSSLPNGSSLWGTRCPNGRPSVPWVNFVTAFGDGKSLPLWLTDDIIIALGKREIAKKK